MYNIQTDFRVINYCRVSKNSHLKHGSITICSTLFVIITSLTLRKTNHNWYNLKLNVFLFVEEYQSRNSDKIVFIKKSVRYLQARNNIKVSSSGLDKISYILLLKTKIEYEEKP